jgi:rhamnosyltransferase
MKIAILGTRGIPPRYGGFETFAQKISSLLAADGHELCVVGENDNASEVEISGGIRIMESDFRKSLNPLRFYFNSLKKDGNLFDVVLVCGVGGAVFYPIFRRKGKFLITNVDGMEHLRTKYPFYVKAFVRLSQYFTACLSDRIIADSEEVSRYWKETFPAAAKKVRCIAYGADPAGELNPLHLEKYQLETSGYYLVVARFVPENHIHTIIEAFINSGTSSRLVLVGSAEPGRYRRRLESFRHKSLIFTGAIYDKPVLDSLRRGAKAYLHGHSVGGTNPSLLEAMAASCICICHDNVYNHEVTSSKQLYFRNTVELRDVIRKLEMMDQAQSDQFKNAAYIRFVSAYTWEKVKSAYLRVLSESNEGTGHL